MLQVLDDIQAIDTVVINVTEQTSITDDMIICSGRSSRHVKAIAETVLEQMKAQGFKIASYSGLDAGNWVLIDCFDSILHVMLPETRTYYDLESLWTKP